MRFIVAAILALSATMAALPAAHAQNALTQGLTRDRAAPGPIQPPRVLFTLGGFNGVIDAPVEGPDSGVAYQTYAGQPMTGREALLPGTQPITGR